MDVAGEPPATAAATPPGRLPPLVIANPAAHGGRARDEVEAIVTALQERIGAVDLALTEHAGHASALARRAVLERRTLVVSVGGDGVLNEVVNGLLTAPTPGGRAQAAPSRRTPGGPPDPDALPALGLVAAGTGGDLGRSLGIAAQRDAYISAVAHGRPRPVDVGLARFRGPDGSQTERFFVNVLSAGIGGLVDRYAAALPATVPGRAAYGVAALAAVAACRRRRLRCRAVLGDGSVLERELHTYAVVVANGHTFGGGMRVAPAARVDDGLFDVVLFEPPSKLTLVRHFPTIYSGRHLTKPGVSSFTCRRLELSPCPATAAAPAPHDLRRELFPLDVDGDALGDLPLAVEVWPRCLRVLSPDAA